MTHPTERSARSRGVDVAALAVVAACALPSFGPVFGGGSAHLVAGGAGVVLGLGLAAVATWRRWSLLTTAAATAACYLLLAGAVAAPTTTVAGVVPTLDTLRLVAAQAVQGWMALVTATPPATQFPGLLVVPFLLALVTTVVAGSIALRTRRPAWALLPLALLLTGAIALGTRDATHPVAQGVVAAAAAVAWVAWRRETRRGDVTATGDAVEVDPAGRMSVRRRRARDAAGIIAVACAVGGLAAPVLADEGPRRVLRDVIRPPLDLRDYASPLVSFRRYVRDYADTPLFTLEGLPEGARVRLATLDGFDGVVYDVTDGSGQGASFVRVGDRVPEAAGAAPGQAATVTVTVGEYADVWLPAVGRPTGVRFDGGRAEDLARSLHVNPATGVAIATAGLLPGDVYAMDVVVPDVPTDEELAGRPPATVRLPDVTNVPDVVASRGAAVVADATDAVGQARALQAALSADGFFSHGLAGDPPSRAGHGAERIATFLSADQLVGDDEQYAVAMALMARQLGMPARVVLGFHGDGVAGPGPVDITGEQLRAWVEIAFEGRGWVPFDPTPPEDQVPQEQAPEPRANPQPQVLQPPPPAEEPADVPPDPLPEDGTADEDTADDSALRGPLLVALATGVPLLLLLAPFLAVVTLKRRRARRRARLGGPSRRVSGGWREVVDAAVDLGTTVPPSATRRETADALAAAYPRAALHTLADRTDGSVFAADEPSEEEVRALWREVEASLAGMHASVGRWHRLRARVSTRSLRHGRRHDGRHDQQPERRHPASGRPRPSRRTTR